MEGANAVLARHEQFLERDELTRMLLRQLRLSNVSPGVYLDLLG